MKKYNIAHFGAFDIDSFGDSLFAQILNKEINERIDVNEIILFSVTEKQDSYNNNGHVYSYKQFDEINEKIKFDAIVIGGGEMLHFKPIEFKNGDNNEKKVYPEGYIWRFPIEKAKEKVIPVYFNCLGISYNFTKEEYEMLYDYMKYVNYISVRDRYSQKKLDPNNVNGEIIHCVPDSVFIINKYYDLNKINIIKSDVSKKLNINLDCPYILFQYGTSYKLDEVVKQLKLIKENYNYNIILFPINYCHEDLSALKYINSKLFNETMLIEKKLEPKEIIAIISNCEMFIGTSLHGNLTATVFGKKIIVLDMYRSFLSKLDGLVDILELEKNIIPEFESLYKKFNEIINDNNYEQFIKGKIIELQEKVYNHFNNLADIIKKPKPSLIYDHKLEIRDDLVIEDPDTVKSYLYNKQYNDFYRSISNYNNKYEFEFDFGNNINLKDMEWNLYSNYPIQISNLNCKSNNKTFKMIPINQLNSNMNSTIFTGYNIKYIFMEECLTNKILIECEISNFSKEKSIQLLRDNNNNCNAHIQQLIESERYLNGELTKKEGHIKLLLDNERKLNNETIELNDKIVELNDEIVGLNNKIMGLNNETVELNDEIKQLKLEIKNKKGHIELLLESDRELERIKSSRLWRYMTYIWKVRDIVLPNGSKRRLLIKLGVKAVKHPIKFLKKCTPKRIGMFFYYLRREGVTSVSVRLDECVIGNCTGELNFKIESVNEKKVYEVSDFEKLVFQKESNPKVSIIIPVYNQINYTYACLKSILENSGDISYEIIIANDCSTDITKKIDKFVENIKVITTDKNMRFLLNCNNAAKYADGEYILFLNNDTQVQKNWLKPLVELIEKDETIGMVGSKLIYPDGRLQEAGGIIWNDASGWNYGRLSNPQEPEYNYVKECDYISGAAMMIKHNLWKEIGGFDERFIPAYYEDTDLAFEVRKHGYRVMLQSASVVVHFEGISNGTDLSSGQKAYQIKNAEKFKEKWQDELKKQFNNGENVFLAKDRSGDKKHILVVDHYVPHHDKDAGGKCTYMYLKLFVSLGMKVTFIGDNFYPHQPYTLELQQMGIEVLYGNYYCNNWKIWLKENGQYFNYVYLNRPHISEKYIDLVKKYTNAKIVYFGHDLHYLREYREYEITGEKSKLKSSNEWKEKEFDLFNKADVIHVVGSYEQGILKEEFKNKPVRNIPVYIYDSVRDDVNKNFDKRENIIFVGGFGHPPNSDAVMWFAEKIFPRILRKYPNLIWYIVGSKPPENIQKLACENIVVTGFISDEELAKLYEKSRIAVVPLRVGAGVKGKVIEAMYNQIPLVTTSIGAEGLSLEENAFIIADKEEEFADSVIELYEDFEKLEELSDNSIKFIKKHFTSEVAQNAILSDIDI